MRDWIEKHLGLKVNAAKSGRGEVWEGKFLGFRLRSGFKAKVREVARHL
jgi:hypothetical protein